jgi:predicted Zn finger-like uncharacterized protein
VTVQCPRCQTQYRVPEERLSHRRPTFKCTRCGHTFPAERTGPTVKRSEPERNLSFSFEPADVRGPREGLGAEDETFTAPTKTREEPAFVTAAADGDAERARRGGPVPRDEIPSADEDPELDGEDATAATAVLMGAPPDRRTPIHPRTVMATPRPRRSPVRPVGIGVVLTLLLYLGAAIYLKRQPELTLDTLAQVPLLGRLIGDDNLLAWRLELVDVEGGVDQIKGRRPAYIVSGRAVNTTGEPLRIIEVEGRLIAGGVVRQQRRAYAANQFKKTVKELSASEVEMLLRLEPNRRFVVQPGESARFLIVFPDPPADLTGVECRVVDARTT